MHGHNPSCFFGTLDPQELLRAFNEVNTGASISLMEVKELICIAKTDLKGKTTEEIEQMSDEELSVTMDEFKSVMKAAGNAKKE